MRTVFIRPGGENQLNKVAFFLQDEWREDAEVLFKMLHLEGFREASGECAKTWTSNRPGEFSGVWSSYTASEKSMVVFTDDRALARRLAACGIVCIGCMKVQAGDMATDQSADLMKEHSAYFDGAGLVVEQIADLEFQELEEYYLHSTGQPVTIARTERLVLREITEEDIEEICRISQQEEMETALDLLQRKNFTPENLRAYIREVYRFYGYGLWCVCRKDGRVIGCCGLSDFYFDPWMSGEEKQETEDRRGLELQYMVDSSLWNQGYGTEMCKAVLGWAFSRTGEARIWIRVHRSNLRSRHLAQKLGFIWMAESKKGICLYCMEFRDLSRRIPVDNALRERI